MHEFGCDSRRHAVSHRTARRPELGAQSRVLIETVHPQREIAGAVSDYGFRRHAFAQVDDHFAHVERARRCDRLLPRFVCGARGMGVFRPRRLDRRELDCCRSKFRHAGIDQQIALINAAELLGAGVHVDELLLRAWDVDQRVIDGGPFS